MSTELINTIISKIPQNWMIDRIKHQVEDKPYSIVDGPFGTQLHNDEYVDEGVPVIRIVNLNYNGRFDPEKLVFITEEKYQSLKRSSVEEGDLIIAKTGATIGKVGVFEGYEKGIIASSCLKVSLNNNISPDFFKYYLISDYCQKQIMLSSSGSTRDTINMDQISNLQLVLPQNIITQQQIAKIDETITKNQQLLELLEEKRVALFNQKIIDIEYESIKLKDVLKIGGYIRGPFGSSLKRDELKYEGIPVYEQQHAIHNSRDFRYFIDRDKFKELIRFKTYPNDLIISCSGTVGKISIISDDDPIGIISQALLILRIDDKKILPKFLSYFLSSHKGHDYLVSESNGTAQVNISQKDIINKIPIKLPPMDTQKEIVDELEHLNLRFNKIINKVNENINLLEEYKTSLIHHVVTGKIDISGEEI